MWDELIKDLPWHKKIKILRAIKGWTQEEMAKKCMTNQKGWWQWEVGKAYPREIFRHAIANAFEVNIDDIFPKE